MRNGLPVDAKFRREKRGKMTIDDLKRVDLIEYARSHFDIDAKENGSAHCPFHPPDRNPSFSFLKADDGHWIWTDFHDGETGTIIDLCSRMNGTTDGETIRRLLEEFDTPGGQASPDKRIILRSHIYRDRSGNPVFKKVKYSDGEYGLFHWNGSTWIHGKGSQPPLPYNLDRFEGSDMIIICEGEKDADTLSPLLEDSDIIATSVPYGKASWPDEISRYFSGCRDFIFMYDVGNDEHVKKHAHKLHRSFPDARISLAHVPMSEHEADITDYLSPITDKLEALLEVLSKAEDLYRMGRPVGEQEAVYPRPVLINLDRVSPKPIEWLWQARFPLGKLSLIVGDPGQGKSYLTLVMAKHVTKGETWPASSDAPERGSVILLSAEDGVADTIRSRAELIGADLSKIKVLSGIATEKDGQKTFDISNDLPCLEAAIQAIGDVRVVFIDPISSYLGRINAISNSEVRGALAPLADLADKYKVALIGVSHLNKKQDLRAMYRTLDSMAFVAAARTVWLVAPDPRDPSKKRKLFMPIKVNLSTMPSSLAFTIGETGPEFEPEGCEIDADTFTSTGQVEANSALDEAKQWLREILAEGSVGAKEVIYKARESGIKERTLKRAKGDLRIESVKVGSGPEVRWCWRLPNPTASHFGRQ